MEADAAHNGRGEAEDEEVERDHGTIGGGVPHDGHREARWGHGLSCASSTLRHLMWPSSHVTLIRTSRTRAVLIRASCHSHRGVGEHLGHEPPGCVEGAEQVDQGVVSRLRWDATEDRVEQVGEGARTQWSKRSGMRRQWQSRAGERGAGTRVDV